MAKYIEIADDLRERIRNGEYRVGSKLPGIGSLQELYGVSGLNTVRAAHQILIEEGLIRTEQGVGTFVVALPSSCKDSIDLLAELRSARTLIDRAIRELELRE